VAVVVVVLVVILAVSNTLFTVSQTEQVLLTQLGQPVRVIENQLKANTLNVPLEVRDYLLSHEERQEGTYRGFFGELWQNLVDFALDSWARITTGQKARPAPVDPQVAFILNYLEEELEVSHDDSGQ
jgi:regulator of protease activity HflC (stomatin/prohibitin superfamily)